MNENNQNYNTVPPQPQPMPAQPQPGMQPQPQPMPAQPQPGMQPQPQPMPAQPQSGMQPQPQPMPAQPQPGMQPQPQPVPVQTNNVQNTQQGKTKSNKNLVILILSIINLILIFFPGGILFFLIAIVLLVFSIIGLKAKDVKATISLILNIIAILYSIVAFIVSLGQVVSIFGDAKTAAVKTTALSIIQEAEYNKDQYTGTILCTEVSQYIPSDSFENCSVNFDGSKITINIKTKDNLCIYNGTSENIKVEKCK